MSTLQKLKKSAKQNFGAGEWFRVEARVVGPNAFARLKEEITQAPAINAPRMRRGEIVDQRCFCEKGNRPALLITAPKNRDIIPVPEGIISLSTRGFSRNPVARVQARPSDLEAVSQDRAA